MLPGQGFCPLSLKLLRASPGQARRDLSDVRYKAMYRASLLGENVVENPTSPFYSIQVLSFPCIIKTYLILSKKDMTFLQQTRNLLMYEGSGLH